MRGLAPSSYIGIVNDVVVHQGRGVNELDDRGIGNGARAGIATEPRGHQQHGGSHALATAHLQVVADFRNDVNLRLHLFGELTFNRQQVVADGFEQLDQVRLSPGCDIGHVPLISP